MADLSNSRWANASHRNGNAHTPDRQQRYQSSSAPTNGNGTSAFSQLTQLSQVQRDLLSRRSDAIKFMKLTRRLKWKSRILLYAYYRVVNERQENLVGSVGFAMEDGEAEMMFKIDFFEFYVLLERVLVHLLGVVGIAVSAAYGRNTKPEDDGLRSKDVAHTNHQEPKSLREQLMEQHRQNSLIGDSRMFHGYAHRFHANVLAALDLPQNPLHGILGQGDVRDYLGIAKEFRNRWKDAEEKPADQVEDGLVGSRYEKMLNDLKLEEMLRAILTAIDEARACAEAEFNRFANTVDIGDNLQEAMMELDENAKDAPWEAMPDAMEWD